MLSVVLSTSAALAGKQKSNHTHIVTVKREGQPESPTYFHFWGTVIQWKIHTSVDRTEYVDLSVQ